MPTRSRASTRRRLEFGPDGDGEHAAQLLKAAGVPLQKRVQNGFGVAVRVEAVAQLLQLGPDFQVVVDFAVEDDDGVAVVASGWAGRRRAKSRIFRRVAPSEQVADSYAPCWSGPRWTSVAVASAIRSGRGNPSLCVKPYNPAHVSLRPGVANSLVTKLSQWRALDRHTKGRRRGALRP